MATSEEEEEYGLSDFSAYSYVLMESFAASVYSCTMCVCFKNLYLAKQIFLYTHTQTHTYM